MSLYCRLFLYRGREGRKPLEDFLTEALADILNRGPERLSRRIVALFLKNAGGAYDSLSQFWPSGLSPSWRTQVRTSSGKIVDMVMAAGRTDLIAIELKVGAGFQHHSESSSAIPPQHQLATYASWIAENSPKGWGGCAVLVTHWTPPPDDFLTDKKVFQCAHRGVAWWADVGRLLAKEVQNEEKSDWTALSLELIAFLKEQRMTDDLMTTTDIAGLNVFLTMSSRIQATIYHVWEQTAPSWKKLCQQRSYSVEYDGAHGCIWAFRYLKHPQIGPEGFLAFGIRFPELSLHRKSINHEATPHIFVEVVDGGASSLDLGNGWVQDAADDAWTASLPIAEMPNDPAAFAERAIAWSKDRYVELNATVPGAPLAH